MLYIPNQFDIDNFLWISQDILYTSDGFLYIRSDVELSCDLFSSFESVNPQTFTFYSSHKFIILVFAIHYHRCSLIETSKNKSDHPSSFMVNFFPKWEFGMHPILPLKQDDM